MNLGLAKKNVVASLVYEIIAMIYGLIIPRIILATFGSEVNGLVSSLSQFLNYITLLEGGLTGVIMASLYKPLAEKDMDKISGIIVATDAFFKKIALIFVGYSIIIAVIYPIMVHTSFSWGYVFSLTLLIGVSLFIQYFFSLTYRLLINADQRGYIVFIAQIIFTVVNIIITVIIVNVWPEIHVLKLFNVIAYIMQPVIYGLYVKKKYKLNKQSAPDKKALSQRWDGFGQNIAYFIHTNTDVVVLTVFNTLANVSVYAVYFMIANSLKTLIMSISSAVTPSMGNILVSGTDTEKNSYFDYYEFAINAITIFAFVCGALLITPFVSVYTLGVTDADYYQPIFGYILVAAEAIYCLRTPYINVAYAAGHFKQTAKYAYIEAVLNITISIALVVKVGLVGIAIGTALSMIYRYVVHVFYLRKHILYRPIKKWIKSLTMVVISTTFMIVAYFLLVKSQPSNYLQWFTDAAVTAIIAVTSVVFFSVILYKELFFKFIRNILKK